MLRSFLLGQTGTHGSTLVARRTNDKDGDSHNSSQGHAQKKRSTPSRRDPEYQEMKVKEK